jgi:hypothetical protein
MTAVAIMLALSVAGRIHDHAVARRNEAVKQTDLDRFRYEGGANVMW